MGTISLRNVVALRTFNSLPFFEDVCHTRNTEAANGFQLVLCKELSFNCTTMYLMGPHNEF